MKRFYARLVERGISIKFQFNHGVSLAFYFQDPEGNLIEVYWRTGLEYAQPSAQEIDLSKTEKELLAELKVPAIAMATAAQDSSSRLSCACQG